MAIDLSVVTGTFNRIDYLKKMVASVRSSLEPGGCRFEGVAHEIVVVDGGSTDGTLDWVRAQPDCRLIEHGELLGAVKAFNDGARAAAGRYVVLANDDVEFQGDGLARAFLFMEAHPAVGVGCFYQDRSDPGKPPAPWHVEQMPAVHERGGEYTPIHVPYGQVCIVPKMLGDRLGWWGDYLHTYGGDNELSSQVYEAGYKVVPLYWGKERTAPVRGADLRDVAAIHDNKPDDALRKLNNIGGASDPRAVRGAHPDSFAWGRKWTRRWRAMRRRDLGGPLVAHAPKFEVERGERERFLYLPIYEQGWAVQKEQKRGLREALTAVGPVAEYDYVGRAAEGADLLAELRGICSWLRPTVLLFQLHGPDPIGPDAVARLRQEAPGAWFVNWNGDYWPQNLLSDGGVALARAFDLQLTVNRAVLEEYASRGVSAAYWQIGWEPDGVGHEPRPEDRCDVVFLANGYSKERAAFVAKLRKLPHSLRLWGNGWPDGWSVGQCTYDFVTACRAYRGARFSIGDSQWPDSGFVSNRVMQALAAGGSALCHQWFRGMEHLGLVDGETCVVWRDFGELADKLARWSADEEGRRRIAEAGERLALERHGFGSRVAELMMWKPSEDDWR
jgi:hypothetical protein